MKNSFSSKDAPVTSQEFDREALQDRNNIVYVKKNRYYIEEREQ